MNDFFTGLTDKIKGWGQLSLANAERVRANSKIGVENAKATRDAIRSIKIIGLTVAALATFATMRKRKK